MQFNICEINKLVINLPERTDRLQLFHEEFKRTFPNEPYLIEPGVIETPAHIGIAKAHLNCIRRAIENKWDNVLIMEDDVFFVGNTERYFETIFNEAPRDWDVLLGGLYWLSNFSTVGSWMRVSEFCGLQFYIVNKRAYQTLLNYENTDRALQYDRWMGRQGLNVYAPNKFFAIQRDGYSDNVKKVTDYNQTYLTKFKLLND
jgi:GR25 family glycosyltransferase involved in LPS biosynthesis